MKVVIVGGVAGGATAAARIRRLDEQAEIVVFERSLLVEWIYNEKHPLSGGVSLHMRRLSAGTSAEKHFC